MNEAQPINEAIKERRLERWVGVFVLLAVLLLLAGFGYHLYHTAERKGWLIPHAPYFTYVMTGDGLNIGDPVTLMGFNVGAVKGITAQSPGGSNRVYVAFEIRKPYYGYILSDSHVNIAMSGFLGSRRLEVTPGLTGIPTIYETNGVITEVLYHGQRIPFTKSRKGVFLRPHEDPSVTDRAQKLLDQLEVALPNILAITNRLNNVLDNASVLLTNSNALVINLSQTSAQLAPVISNAAVITANLRDPHGSLGEWALPVDLHTNLNTSLVTLTAGLNDTLLNLAAITGNLNSQVQSNDQMLAGISKLVVDTDNLVQGLKKHWLLRGVFPQPKPVSTNAPPKTIR